MSSLMNVAISKISSAMWRAELGHEHEFQNSLISGRREYLVNRNHESTRRRSLYNSRRIRCGFLDCLQYAHWIQVLFWFSLTTTTTMTTMVHGAASNNSSSVYACQGKTHSCKTTILYRTRGNYGENLTSVSALFDTNVSIIATASGLNLSSTPLLHPTPFYIPVNCTCMNGTYQDRVPRIIQYGDTFSGVASEYEGLTKNNGQAIIDANPQLNPDDLQNGTRFVVPLNCACPWGRQKKTDEFLLSFANFPGEDFTVVESYFNVKTDQLARANYPNVNSTGVQAFSTILVPLVKLPPLSSIHFISQTNSTSPPPPPPSSSPPPPPSGGVSGSGSGSYNKKLYVGLGIGIGIGLLLASLVAICVLLVWHISQQQKPGQEYQEANLESDRTLTNDSSGITKMYAAAGALDMAGPVKLQTFSDEELREATEDFSDTHRIQGSVFLGKLSGELVAIKQMKGNAIPELKILTQVHHANLVKLIGICANNTENLYLVFDYAKNRSLSDCLHYNSTDPTTTSFSQSIPFLPWTTRIHIALDVATGLDYIHNYTNPSFVHKDVKSSNILIDGNFQAKIANFGLAKPADSSNQSGDGIPMLLTRHIVGTQGYIAPEYLEHGLVTTKADVFAFGVVLLEILSGKEAMVRRQLPSSIEGDNDGQVEERPLSSLFREEVVEGENFKEKLQVWIDPLLQNAYPLDTACSIAGLANTCLNSDLALRPDMKDISHTLSKMLASSIEWESSVLFGAKNMSYHSIDVR